MRPPTDADAADEDWIDDCTNDNDDDEPVGGLVLCRNGWIIGNDGPFTGRVNGLPFSSTAKSPPGTRRKISFKSSLKSTLVTSSKLFTFT